MLRLALVVGLLVTAAQGCSHSSTSNPQSDGAMPLFTIESGTYAVSNIVTEADDCGLALTTANFPSLHVDNNGMAHLRLGAFCNSSGTPPTCDPAGDSFGDGDFVDSQHGTAKSWTTVTTDAMGACSYARMRVVDFTATGDDRLHLELSENDSEIAPACTAPSGTTSRCSSRFGFDLTMPRQQDGGR